MPRLRIIILDQTADDQNTYNYVLWADVPAARQTFYANTSAKSAWLTALAADNTALQNGSVVELVGSLRVPNGATLAQIENFLQNKWTNYQNFINTYNPWIRYGSTWDGTTWSIANNG